MTNELKDVKTEQEKQDLRLKLFCIKDSDDEIKLKIVMTNALKVLLKSLTIDETEKVDLTRYDIFNSLNNEDSNDLRSYNKIIIQNPSDMDKVFTKKRQKELIALNEQVNIERYKVKSAFYNSMTSDYKQILFIKKLIDDGSIELKIYQLGTLDNFSEYLKGCIADIFKGLKNLNFKQEIILKPMGKDEFKDVDKALKHSVKEYEKKRKEQERVESMSDAINEAISNNSYQDDDDMCRCSDCDDVLETYTDNNGVIRCRGCENYIFNTRTRE